MEKSPSPSPNKPTRKRRDKPAVNYLQYAHLSFQMMAIMGASVWLGMKLDKYCQTESPWLLCLFALGGAVLAIFSAVRALI
jgi:F0F1-type ATP synthase assembly protein I